MTARQRKARDRPNVTQLMKPPPNKYGSGAVGLAGVAVAIIAVAGALCGPRPFISSSAARLTDIEDGCSFRTKPMHASALTFSQGAARFAPAAATRPL